MKPCQQALRCDARPGPGKQREISGVSNSDSPIQTPAQRLSQSAEYQIDAYVIFMERGCQLNHTKGFIGFIIPTTYIGMHYFSTLRHFILKNTSPSKLVKLKFPVFDDATVESSIAILQAIGNGDQINSLGQSFIYDSVSSFLQQDKAPTFFKIEDILNSDKNDFFFLQEQKGFEFIKCLKVISSKLKNIC